MFVLAREAREKAANTLTWKRRPASSLPTKIFPRCYIEGFKMCIPINWIESDGRQTGD